MIPYSTSLTTEDDYQAIDDFLRSNAPLTRGRQTARLEELLCEVSGKKHAVAVSNGTVALLAALKATRDLEVFSPTLTFSAVANASGIINNYLPNLYDVDVDSLCTNWWEYAGLDGSIVAMDYGGYPHLKERPQHFIGSIVLDAAHSLGATLENGESNTKHADIATYSFHPAKILTTAGEGGAVVTDSDDFYKEILMFRNNGFEPGTHDHVTFGINAHITELQAVMGISQLKRLRDSIKRRNEIANYYYSAWNEDVRVILPAWARGHSWHLFVLRFSEFVKCDMPTFMSEMLERGVTCQRHYKPLHMQKIFSHLNLEGTYPVAEHAYERMLSIPMFFGLSDSDVGVVINAVNQVMEKYS